MLCKNTNEAFKTAIDGSMDDDGADVTGPKAAFGIWGRCSSGSGSGSGSGRSIISRLI